MCPPWCSVRTGVLTLVISVIGASLVVLAMRAFDARHWRQVTPLIAEVAPDLYGQDFDGKMFDLGTARGRWVIVNFLAPWCLDCEIEQPELERLARRHQRANDLQIISVVVESEPGDAIAFYHRHQITWPYLLDPTGETSVAYGRLSVPESFLIAPDGTVAARLTGGVEADQIDRLIAG